LVAVGQLILLWASFKVGMRQDLMAQRQSAPQRPVLTVDVERDGRVRAGQQVGNARPTLLPDRVGATARTCRGTLGAA